MVIAVELSALIEVSCVTPGIWPNCRSSGAATDAAMVSALAPWSVAFTDMVGKSTWGSGATGRNGTATKPTKPIAIISSEVATGRRMNGSEMLIAKAHHSCCTARPRGPEIDLEFGAEHETFADTDGVTPLQFQ